MRNKKPQRQSFRNMKSRTQVLSEQDVPWAHLAEFFERPISFHRILVHVTGSITAALFLSQAMYWTKNRVSQERGGWFYKKGVEWEEETGLSRREQESARRRLTQLGILEARRLDIPAKLWFQVDLQRLGKLLHEKCQSRLAKSANLDSTEKPKQMGEKRESNTKTTSQTTTEITDNIKKPLPNGSGKEKNGGKPPAPPMLSQNDVISMWNAIPDVRHVRLKHVTGRDKLSKKITASLKEFPDEEWWQELFKLVRESNFLCGRVDGVDGRLPFMASLMWILDKENLAKVLHGTYEDE
ncbi:hypothetical protein [Candidatus Nitronereus thalassa]|uniref:Replication protein O n=1 Tax=Candidatus Nitronereus thalassa TaxID=3020898 RepID=A0ABU3K8F7_9BACT|nr:hypothetical protein [Candidatus Nitronereus thalassa]MDT7042680.1 hypothetical protein [Candidatus Nitronereus thalassa]